MHIEFSYCWLLLSHSGFILNCGHILVHHGFIQHFGHILFYSLFNLYLFCLDVKRTKSPFSRKLKEFLIYRNSFLFMCNKISFLIVFNSSNFFTIIIFGILSNSFYPVPNRIIGIFKNMS